MGRSPVEGRHYVDLVVSLGDGRAYSGVTAALILLNLFPFFGVEIVRVRVESVKHPKNRSLGQLVEINVTGILVFRDNNRIRKVFGNLLARGGLVGFLSEKLLRRMRAGKCNRNDESDNKQPVTILRFHRGLSPRGKH